MGEPRILFIKRGYTIKTNVYNGQIEAEAFQANLDDCFKVVEFECYEALQKENAKLKKQLGVAVRLLAKMQKSDCISCDWPLDASEALITIEELGE